MAHDRGKLLRRPSRSINDAPMRLHIRVFAVERHSFRTSSRSLGHRDRAHAGSNYVALFDDHDRDIDIALRRNALGLRWTI